MRPGSLHWHSPQEGDKGNAKRGLTFPEVSLLTLAECIEREGHMGDDRMMVLLYTISIFPPVSLVK